MKSPKDFFTGKANTNSRPLRVGEEIRRVLSEIFMRGDVHAEGLSGASITVSEVRVSPDLKNATAFIMPLGGRDKDLLLKILIEAAPEIRHLVSQRVELRHAPKIYFALDESFDAAQKIETILKKPEVARDLHPNSDE